MQKAVAVLFLVLVITSPALSQGKNRRWLNGTWEGTGYQIDNNSTWTMKLKAGRGRYLIEYPSLKCGGRWQLLSINSNLARFRERIDVGKEECVNNGNVVIQRLSRKQVAYRFSYRRTKEISASAILNRK